MSEIVKSDLWQARVVKRLFELFTDPVAVERAAVPVSEDEPGFSPARSRKELVLDLLYTLRAEGTNADPRQRDHAPTTGRLRLKQLRTQSRDALERCPDHKATSVRINVPLLQTKQLASSRAQYERESE